MKLVIKFFVLSILAGGLLFARSGEGNSRVSQNKVINAFRSKGIEIEILNLAQSTKTSVEAAEAVGCKIEQIAKSIIFRDSNNNLIHIFVSGPNKVNFSSCEEETGIKLINADTIHEIKIAIQANSIGLSK